jgi:hypothetical protein
MIGLSTKLQECIVLNMGGSFPEFVSKLRHDKKDHFMIGLSTKLTREGHSLSLSVISSSRMMRSTPTWKQRSGRLCQLYPTVLLQGIRRCTITAPPTHHVSSSSTSGNNSSGLPGHLSASTSMQHPELYLHHHQCRTCLCHRPLEPPPATPASTVTAQATSLMNAPRPRRTPLRAMSPIHHVVRRRWLLQRLASQVRFL